MSFSDMMASAHQAHVAAQGQPATYVLNDTLATATITAFETGRKAVDVFASAQEQDILGVINASDFAAAFPGRASPQRYDRLRVDGRSFAIEAWRGAPVASPVLFKLLLRGSQQ